MPLIFAYSGYQQYLLSIGVPSTDSQHAAGSQEIARNTPPKKANITEKRKKVSTLKSKHAQQM